MKETDTHAHIESILLDEGLADSEVFMIDDDDDEAGLGNIVIPAQFATTEDQNST
ncbi:hypothetical protein NW755_003919 [Fusarium falciforme]|uniref:Uncharacterized protein n=1 Tax=Fusarium falciforme TaxID=195108 RepID=A0A9W8V535_9HYPO|nr:hypothetical protein NW755_003919 [Fusarium falciforme]